MLGFPRANEPERVFFMFAKVYSACLSGIHANLIQVEIDISPGLPQFHIVGLPDLALKNR